MDELRRALDEAPAPVTFWWRDDDAGRPDDRLTALLQLAHGRAVPVAMAVVPAWLKPEVRDALVACPTVTILQHGIAHHNQALPDGRKIELGGSASIDQLKAGLAVMRTVLATAFADRFLAVLVPPWNRIAADLVGALPDLGFHGWSAFGDGVATGLLCRVDTHLDLVQWRDGRAVLTTEEAAAALARLIRTRPGEPLGILSHHLVTDLAGFAMLDRLLGVLQDHPRARLLAAADLFGENPLDLGGDGR